MQTPLELLLRHFPFPDGGFFTCRVQAAMVIASVNMRRTISAMDRRFMGTSVLGLVSVAGLGTGVGASPATATSEDDCNSQNYFFNGPILRERGVRLGARWPRWQAYRRSDRSVREVLRKPC